MEPTDSQTPERAGDVVIIKSSYALMDKLTYEQMFLESCRCLGWKQKALFNHHTGSFCAVYHQLYRVIAEVDAIARGFIQHQGDHFRALVDWDSELPPYVSGVPDYAGLVVEPGFIARAGLDAMPGYFDQSGVNPLGLVTPPPNVNTNRRRFTKTIEISEYNAVILRLAMVLGGYNMSELMTRLITWHFARYWTSGTGSYTRQIQGSIQSTLSPDLSNPV